jgi:hypothetical protein
MALTPRTHETDAVVEILDSGAFDGPAQMAGAIVKRVAQLVQERDGKDGVGLYLVVLEGALFGPFYTEGDAERWKDDAGENLRLRGRVLRLWAPTTYALVEKHSSRDTRCACGHAKEQHREKKKGQGVQHAECGVWNRKAREWCPCTNYRKEIR